MCGGGQQGTLLVRTTGFSRLFSQKTWQEKACSLTTKEFCVFKVTGVIFAFVVVTLHACAVVILHATVYVSVQQLFCVWRGSIGVAGDAGAHCSPQ